MPTRATATWQSDGSLEIASPYKADYVQELKDDLPSGISNRRWESGKKVWQFSAYCAQQALEIARRHYDVVDEIQAPVVTPTASDFDVFDDDYVDFSASDRPPIAALPPVTRTYFQVLNVPQSATPEEIRKGYLTAVKTAHPDRGGDATVFLLIKQAYEVLRDEQQRQRYLVGLKLMNQVKRGRI